WKSCDGGTRPEVQILFSAPQKGKGNVPFPFCVFTENREGFEGGAASESEHFASTKKFRRKLKGKTGN
ncbi:MAG: hypothetical protein IJX98_00005, partial [Clostridia bacterium]|nr:hypothetical protein [Clostridia bacterium]